MPKPKLFYIWGTIEEWRKNYLVNYPDSKLSDAEAEAGIAEAAKRMGLRCDFYEPEGNDASISKTVD